MNHEERAMYDFAYTLVKSAGHELERARSRSVTSKLLVVAFRSPLIWEEALEYFPQGLKLGFAS